MTQKKERVIAALNHRETDFAPYHAEFTEQGLERMKSVPGGEEFLTKEYSHLHYIQYWGWPTELPEKPGHFRDDFGVVWNRNGVDKDIGMPTVPLIPEPDMKYWNEPKLDEARLRAELDELVGTGGGRFVMMGIGFTMFERLWSMCGMEEALVYMIEEPAFVHELLDAVCDYMLRVVRVAADYELDGFYFGDDWGQQHGLIMGPKLWREHIKPRMKRLYDEARKGGRYIIQHSCGDLNTLLPDLVELGVDCYQTFQPEIYDLETVKREYGKDLTFWGGISTQCLLPVATPEEVKAVTARTIAVLGKGGGYIAAPTHAIPGDMPPENIFAMYEVFNNQQAWR